MRLSAILFAAAVVAASGAAAVIGNARADNDCSECRELRDDLDRMKRETAERKHDVDALQRQLEDMKRHHGGAQRIVFHVTRSLDFQNGEQQCGDNEVVVGYRHTPGKDHIRGDCAEVRLE